MDCARQMKIALIAVLLAFFQYEIPDSNGMTKICVYETYRGQHTLIVKAWQLCPQTLRVE